ncbi:MAG: quinoprotein dehydrogenase-associated SoxYZ-like carrier, partial [Proteobacteria bacterium]|nr:quinoprotein dehydrogenase-associated SoxYZ-like carrier [Pseudomonadota bacterium]
MRRTASLALTGTLALLAGRPALADAPADPLASPLWSAYAASVLGHAPVVFDPLVKLDLPLVTENQHEFPVTVDARALGHVERIVVFSDLNPIPVAIDYRPVKALAFVALRIKLDQKTPVRAAVLTRDGTWHLAGQWVDAAGGGCSAPPVSRVRGDWADHLGELRGALWREADATRLRFALRHPMDTGFVDNVPAYNLERVTVTDAKGG